MTANRLGRSPSRYLQQHAHNPVDWYPWGAEALECARREDRPILLSIGYSACHWCHVMAHESFEDEGTAALMNRLFVNIKVDREERPDLDRIYQSAHQLLTQRSGGWPLTLFLTPGDLMPYFAGTYFPRHERFGLPAFRDLLLGVESAYREQKEAIRHQSDAIQRALDQAAPPPVQGQALNAAPISVAVDRLKASLDREWGGFGGAPKFPHCPALHLLLRHWRAKGDADALRAVELTLERMALGGLQDQLGGGFYRYAVDARWEIPHFEKMLYDNAQLLPLYADAWQATGRGVYREAARLTAEWVLREMQDPAGGFYSSLDADSEGGEGAFYVWSQDELHALLEPAEVAFFTRRFGLGRTTNFEGRWHLNVVDPTLSAEESALLAAAQARLMAVRATRPRPGRDEKVLTAWNALMIKGLARAGRVLGEPSWIRAAEAALARIQGRLWRGGRLLAVEGADGVGLMGYLDDHAMLLDASLELLSIRWKDADFVLARRLADLMLTHFQDPRGGFFFTANDHERLVQRPKPLSDDSLPAGNGVAALALMRLGRLLAEPRYEEAARDTLRAAWLMLRDHPHAHCSLLLALDEYLNPGESIVIRGTGDSADWLEAAVTGYEPRRSVFAIPADAGFPHYPVSPEGAIAFVCRAGTCEAPIRDLAALRARLGSES